MCCSTSGRSCMFHELAHRRKATTTTRSRMECVTEGGCLSYQFSHAKKCCLGLGSQWRM